MVNGFYDNKDIYEIYREDRHVAICYLPVNAGKRTVIHVCVAHNSSACTG